MSWHCITVPVNAIQADEDWQALMPMLGLGDSYTLDNQGTDDAI